MRLIEALMLAAGIGRSVYGRWRLQRLLSALVVVAMLAVTAAVMISLLAIGGFYAAYLYFLSRGMEPMIAALMTGLLILIFVAVLIMTIRRRMCELKSPVVAAPLGDTVDAFLDGLLSK